MSNFEESFSPRKELQALDRELEAQKATCMHQVHLKIAGFTCHDLEAPAAWLEAPKARPEAPEAWL